MSDLYSIIDGLRTETDALATMRKYRSSVTDFLLKLYFENQEEYVERVNSLSVLAALKIDEIRKNLSSSELKLFQWFIDYFHNVEDNNGSLKLSDIDYNHMCSKIAERAMDNRLVLDESDRKSYDELTETVENFYTNHYDDIKTAFYQSCYGLVTSHELEIINTLVSVIEENYFQSTLKISMSDLLDPETIGCDSNAKFKILGKDHLDKKLLMYDDKQYSTVLVKGKDIKSLQNLVLVQNSFVSAFVGDSKLPTILFVEEVPMRLNNVDPKKDELISYASALTIKNYINVNKSPRDYDITLVLYNYYGEILVIKINDRSYSKLNCFFTIENLIKEHVSFNISSLKTKRLLVI
jgi:hypothetical protein